MPYERPAGDAVNFQQTGVAYARPAGNAVDFSFQVQEHEAVGDAVLEFFVEAYAFHGVSAIGDATLDLVAEALGEHRSLGFDPRTRVQREAKAPWGASRDAHIGINAPFGATTKRDAATRLPHGTGQDRDRTQQIIWLVTRPTDLGRHAPWGRYDRVLQPEQRYPWRGARKADDDLVSPWGRYDRVLQPEQRYPWRGARKADRDLVTPWGGPMLRIVVDNRIPWRGSRARSLEQWIPWTRYSRTLDRDWGVVPPPTGPVIVPGETIIVPTRRTYIVQNEIALYRVDDNSLIEAFSISMDLDSDSFAWSFRATIPGASLAAVEPGSGGEPVELALYVNGMVFNVLVESISRDRAFPSSKINISGRSKTALLAAPYAQVLTFGNASAMTAQQLAVDALSVNGVPLPWTVQWGITDWLVPADVWSFRGTHIEAVTRIAEAAGAYLRPHPVDQQIAVLARYPGNPWDWATTVTPDFELPAAITTRESIEWRELPDYNAVYVSGVSEGVLAYVRKTGSAGDMFAPMVTDALNTHVDASRQRGGSVLGATGRKAYVNLRLPVLPSIGVVEPGRFVNYVDGATERVGIVRRSQLQIDYPVVSQTLGVEVHVS